MNTDNKINIIDKICELHPSYGIKVGWSEYTGGMKDTGQWFFRKMLDSSEEELQFFLDSITTKENIPQEELTEQDKEDMNKWYKTDKGIIYNEYFAKKYILMMNKINCDIITDMMINDEA